jgi:uncharacterized protein (DUF488 family)
MKIYTIGHSTHPPDEFIRLLLEAGIKMIADIRFYPSSKKHPHFNKEALQKKLQEADIGYIHLQSLGGRRKPQPDSLNNGWRHAAFRGYADYMASPEFLEAANQLAVIAEKTPTAYMCSESVWWRCHRALVSDHFKCKGWQVQHIMPNGKQQEHPYTQPARIVNGKLSYAVPDLFSGADKG